METIHPTHFFEAKWKWLKTSLIIERVDPTRSSHVYILVVFRFTIVLLSGTVCWRVYSLQCWRSVRRKARWECWLIWFYPCWKYSRHKRLVVWPWSNKLCMSKLLHIAVGSHWRQEVRSSQRGFIFISRTHSLQISGIIFMPINAILTQMDGIYEPNLALYVHWSFCLGK